jgi:hypothetical protein
VGRIKFPPGSFSGPVSLGTGRASAAAPTLMQPPLAVLVLAIGTIATPP